MFLCFVAISSFDFICSEYRLCFVYDIVIEKKKKKVMVKRLETTASLKYFGIKLDNSLTWLLS